METFVDEEADLIVHPVHHVQPVQLPMRGCFWILESVMIPRGSIPENPHHSNRMSARITVAYSGGGREAKVMLLWSEGNTH